MLQITLVSHKHDDDVRVGVVPELLQPPRDVGVRRMLGDIVDQQRTHSTAVVADQAQCINITAMLRRIIWRLTRM